jgi:DNA-binding transcriptional ArsR family regulator
LGSSVRTHNGAEAKKPEFIDGESARAARKAMPSDRMVRALAETFGTLSDPTRVRIISALAGEELCVFDLAHLLGLSGSAISHQLRLLRGQRLVKYRKEGKIAFYSLDDDHIRNLMEECIKHVTLE